MPRYYMHVSIGTQLANDEAARKRGCRRQAVHTACVVKRAESRRMRGHRRV